MRASSCAPAPRRTSPAAPASPAGGRSVNSRARTGRVVATGRSAQAKLHAHRGRAVTATVGSAGGVAQLVERLPRTEEARGSSPLTSTPFGALADSRLSHRVNGRFHAAGRFRERWRDIAHNFGLAVGLQRPWITGNKFYGGQRRDRRISSGRQIAVAVTATYQPSAFDSQGNMTDAGPAMQATLWKALAPQNPIPQA